MIEPHSRTSGMKRKRGEKTEFANYDEWVREFMPAKVEETNLTRILRSAIDKERQNPKRKNKSCSTH
jgi:hypothetical protein